MFRPQSVKSRINKAVDSYLRYAKSIRELGNNRYAIRDKNKYIVDMNLQECTCKDFVFCGNESPCKHIVMVFLYQYFKAKAEMENIPV